MLIHIPKERKKNTATAYVPKSKNCENTGPRYISLHKWQTTTDNAQKYLIYTHRCTAIAPSLL